MSCEYTSEQRRKYTPKKPFRKDLTNPAIKFNDLNYVKSFENRHLRTAPTPLSDLQSIYKQDFQSQPDISFEKTTLIEDHHHVAKYDPIYIDRSKPGYSKYLDSTATSSRIDYVNTSSNDITVKDNITLWTWMKNDPNKKHQVWPIKEDLSDKVKESKLKPRHGDFSILQNTVPHYGLTSENKSRYTVPNRNLEIAFIKSFDSNY